MSQIFESDQAGAQLHLGEQAAIVADAARQHRRGVVDHHRGVADSGDERDGVECRRVRPRRRHVHDRPHGHDHATKTKLERARNNPRVTIEEAEAIERFSPYIQSVMAQAQPQRADRLRHRGDRIGPHSGRHRGLCRVLDVRRRARPDDQPDRDRAQPAGGHSRLGRRRSLVRRRPIRSTRSSAFAACTSASSASARRKGAIFGNSMD